jgi:hypothetical protein
MCICMLVILEFIMGIDFGGGCVSKPIACRWADGGWAPKLMTGLWMMGRRFLEEVYLNE